MKWEYPLAWLMVAALIYLFTGSGLGVWLVLVGLLQGKG